MLPTFLEISKRLLAESNIEKLLTAAMDLAIEASGAERGLIILINPAGDILFETARKMHHADLSQPELEISRSIIEKVRQEKETICLRNALAEPWLKSRDSVARLKILSVICVPLRQAENVIGVLYLDNRSVRGVFAAETCTALTQIADLISLSTFRLLEQKQLQDKIEALEAGLRGKFQFESIVGHHPKMVAILKLVAQVADTDATVLIQGESGTGKEIIARALHFNSRRKDRPFVALNCGALPENLLESELFGHLRGAFTGAIKDKPGWFKTADGGTIFLDEISEMPLALQVKLLRVLQTGEYAPLGSTRIQTCDVRVIAAASRNLLKLVQQEKFREEFYYRLNVIEIELPPLREREDDILLLARHFLQKFAEKYQKSGLKLSREVAQRLRNYRFPGNVRELENLIQRMVVLAEGDEILPDHLPASISPGTTTSTGLASFSAAKEQAIDAFERAYLTECLRTHHGNISQAARAAGIDFKNFHTKLKKYGIDATNFKGDKP